MLLLRVMFIITQILEPAMIEGMQVKGRGGGKNGIWLVRLGRAAGMVQNRKC